jgi:3'-phosphoadenosine 5'-phosphosulfate sulfotransferase (PAPS reductase)/FAD synthetase
MPLTPLQRARQRLAYCAGIYPYFLISASGGKDSNALFPLLAEYRDKNPGTTIGAFHYTRCKGMQCVERPIETLSRRYGVPVYYLPHPDMPQHLYEGFCRPRTVVAERAYQSLIKMVDMENAARLWYACLLSGVSVDDLLPQAEEEEAKLTLGDLKVDPFAVWVCAGQRMNDSLHRRAMLSGFRRQLKEVGNLKLPTGGNIGINPKQRRLYPVADWSSVEVLAYCRVMKLPAAADLGGKDSSGVNPSNKEAMRALKARYPADFNRLAERFPAIRQLAVG